MSKRPLESTEKSRPSTYTITVTGKLPENSADWFNGMLIKVEHDHEISLQTILTCRIRDQAELNGILNWLHSMNLRLIKVVQCLEKDHGREE